MPNDAFTVTAIINELKPKLVSGKINKVMQPLKDEIHILVYNFGKLYKLLISAGPDSARIHLSERSKENPVTAPQFCMLLRKHLTGGEILDIETVPYDRVITLTIANYSELKDRTVKKLRLEIFGRQSNIILCEEDGKIIAPLKVIPFDMTKKRAVMPGLKYEYQGNPDKIPVSDVLALQAFLHSFSGGSLLSYVTSGVMGLSKATAAHILSAALGGNLPQNALNEQEVESIIAAFSGFDAVSKKGGDRPCLLEKDGRYADFFITPYSGLDGLPLTYFESINECIDEFYGKKDSTELIRQKSAAATAALKSAKNKIQKRIVNINEKLEECRSMEKYRIYGELLTANLYQIKPMQSSITVENYYDGSTVDIALDKNLSPAKCAQRYYRQYNKLKTAETISREQLKDSRETLDYILSVESFLADAAAPAEIEEINEELRQAGILKQQQKTGKKSKVYAPDILTAEFEGCKIFVGKNNTQNEYVTFKLGKSSDMWLHTKSFHGAHVILSCPGGKFSERAIAHAARYAAKYSAGKTSDKVEVDYTLKKFVKKPSGAKPGFAVYTDHKTIIVNPQK